MKKIIPLIALTAVALSGCIETKQEITLNPDGSGKVVDEATFQPMNLNLTGAEKDAAAQLKEAVKDELEKAEGVEVWKDVSFKQADDGRVWFKGTAYFKDLSKLKLHNNGFNSGMLKPKLTKVGADGLLLELINEKEGGGKGTRKQPLASMSEEEITKKIQAEKAKYQQAKPMMATLLATLKMDFTIRVPGTVGEATNFKKANDGSLRLTFEGAKLIEALDSMTKDDAWWRQRAIAGNDLAQEGPPIDQAMNEKLYGQKGPIRASVQGATKPLFDYAAEVAVAKQNYPKMVRASGLETVGASAVAAAPAKGEGFKSLKVGGVRLVSFTDDKRGIRPFNGEAGYSLSLVGEFPGAVLNVTGGTVEKAIADNGDNLLPQREWDRKISFPHLSEDKTAVVFDVKLAIPGDEAKGLKELSGKIEYAVGSGSKDVDLGITDLVSGAHGKEHGATIVSVGESKWQKGQKELQLRVDLANAMVKSVTFYDESGNKLDLKQGGYSWADKQTTCTFTTEGEIPAKGRVVLQIYEQFQKYEVPFSVTNISLLGKPLK